MKDTILWVMVALFICATAIIILNLAGDRSLYDYWNLDNEDDYPPRKLDFLRTNTVFYAAVIILLMAVSIFWLYA